MAWRPSAGSDRSRTQRSRFNCAGSRQETGPDTVTPRSSEPAGGFLPAWGSPERDRRPNAAQRLPAAHPGREARNRRACLPVTNTRPAFAQAAGRTKWPGLGRVPVTAVAFKLGDMPQTHRTVLIWTAVAMIDVDPVFVQNGGSARVFSLILAVTQHFPRMGVGGLRIVSFRRFRGDRQLRAPGNWGEAGVSLHGTGTGLMIMGLSKVLDHRGVPCLPCHHACWSRSGSSSAR
jgi:hypothetical protein